ncbi:MAG: hypothetical protein P8I81_06720, partial [Pseudomonadales bacterium]|nr:hypothetical protein [Pseudomonadales bacterium]
KSYISMKSNPVNSSTSQIDTNRLADFVLLTPRIIIVFTNSARMVTEKDKRSAVFGHKFTQIAAVIRVRYRAVHYIHLLTIIRRR